MDAVLQQFFNPAIAAKVFPYLLKGFGTTLLLSLLVIPLGLAGGLVVAVLPTLRRRWLSWLVIAYVDFFRAFPPLVLLLFIYFGAPFLGLNLPAILAVAIGFLLNTSSYYGEIFRAGIESIPRGQWEAARSTGLSWARTVAYVVVPQATRNVLPDLISNTLEVVKLHDARQRRRHPGAPERRAQRTGADVQRDADRSRRVDLSRRAMADRAADLAPRAQGGRGALDVLAGGVAQRGYRCQTSSCSTSRREMRTRSRLGRTKSIQPREGWRNSSSVPPEKGCSSVA